ncbi:galactose-specific lectin nattectin-like [Epinephelus moara]|uniref:galactose-specific lectin nattectin-like n=1 Tax=Epinephelus moara TaxID=300413 RepID=UPI00214E7933|nr:galactose-specific lectin nattectin-like [Epinephelus moara]
MALVAGRSGSDGVGWCHCDHCPDGWTRFGDNCYQFHHEHKTWADAEIDCVAHHGNLASIHGQNEYDFVEHLIHKDSDKDERTWIGGHDMAKEGVWMWSDGTAFDFEGLWGEGEPNNAGHSEHCLEMNYKGGDSAVIYSSFFEDDCEEDYNLQRVSQGTQHIINYKGSTSSIFSADASLAEEVNQTQHRDGTVQGC